MSAPLAPTQKGGPQRNAAAGWCAVVALPTVLSCTPIDDVVFEGGSGASETIRLVDDPVSVPEDAGGISLTLRLEEPAPSPISATFRLVGIEAQDDCQEPDFTSGQGSVGWEEGQTESTFPLWIEDDDLAETDERLKLVIDEVNGAVLDDPKEIEVTILDNDRTSLVSASDHGVVPTVEQDQAPALQAALDAARDDGRGVVVLAPGDYLVGEITVHPGTTLSGPEARLLRPADFGAFFTLVATHSGPEDTQPTLVEGVTIDGQRELQGGYQDWERSGSHLISVSGDAATAGRLNITIEDVSVNSGTGDGIAVGPQSNALLCNILGHDLWRDAVALHGGGSSLNLRHFAATASLGTSGIWMDGETPGFDGTRRVQIELQDVHLSTGDLETTVAQGSSVVLRDVNMDRPPFRLLAPDSTVEIYESRIYMGIPGAARGDEGEVPAHNQWQIPHDVRLYGSTLVVSEQVAEEDEPWMDGPQSLALGEVVWTMDLVEPEQTEGHQLLFEDCKFEVDGMTVDPDDVVYALTSPAEGGSVIVRNSDLGSGFAGWFDVDGLGCFGCVLEN